jgi:chemotaxis-related protein WspB
MRVLTFQVGADRLALPLASVVEVVPRVRLHRPTGAAAWLAGLLLHRGEAVPVVDLFALAGAGECPAALSSRIILVPTPAEGTAGLLGLLAAQVADVRELPADAPRLPSPCTPGQPDFGPMTVEGGEVLRLVDLRRLLPEAGRSQLRALTAEPPA